VILFFGARIKGFSEKKISPESKRLSIPNVMV
jgi:hypothetical protein